MTKFGKTFHNEQNYVYVVLIVYVCIHSSLEMRTYKGNVNKHTTCPVIRSKWRAPQPALPRAGAFTRDTFNL